MTNLHSMIDIFQQINNRNSIESFIRRQINEKFNQYREEIAKKLGESTQRTNEQSERLEQYYGQLSELLLERKMSQIRILLQISLQEYIQIYMQSYGFQLLKKCQERAQVQFQILTGKLGCAECKIQKVNIMFKALQERVSSLQKKIYQMDGRESYMESKCNLMINNKINGLKQTYQHQLNSFKLETKEFIQRELEIKQNRPFNFKMQPLNNTSPKNTASIKNQSHQLKPSNFCITSTSREGSIFKLIPCEPSRVLSYHTSSNLSSRSINQLPQNLPRIIMIPNQVRQNISN